MDNYGIFLETFLCLAYLHLLPSASACGTLSFLVPIDLFCPNYSASLPHKWRLLPVLSLVFCPSVCLSSLHPMSLSIPSVERTPWILIPGFPQSSFISCLFTPDSMASILPVVWNEIKGLLYIVDDLGDLSTATIHIYTVTQGATTLLLFHLEIQITGSNLFDLLFSPYVQLLGVN